MKFKRLYIKVDEFSHVLNFIFCGVNECEGEEMALASADLVVPS